MSLKDYVKKIIGKQSESPVHFVNDGSTGTEIFSGYYNEEYLQQFNSMPEGMDIYDKMRRSDYQVRMLLKAVKNPIISANWGVEAVDDSDEEKEIAEFVRFCLFDDISYPDGSKSKSFREFLSEALSSMDFGFALFEPIYKAVIDHEIWGSYIGIRDIAFRSQKTIYEWHLNKNGSLKGVKQMAYGDLEADVMIPGGNLMVITNDKEGDNYEGISMLRPVYGNWLRKDLYFKIQAMGIERCATGIPKGKVPASAENDKSQMDQFKNMLKRLTSHQSNYILIPESFEVDFTQIPYDPEKVDKVIDAEDRRMAKSFLAGFLELGLGGQAGSQSLGKDLSTIFLNGIELYSENIADTLERNVVTKIVAAKYGKRAKYPQLKATDISNKGGKERAEVAVMLKNAGLISESDALEDSLNRDYDFPIRTTEQKEADKLEKKAAQKEVQAPQATPQLSDIQLADKENATTFIKAKSKDVHFLMQTMLNDRVQLYLKKAEKALKEAKTVPAKRKALESMDVPGQRDYRNRVRLEMANIAAESTRRVLVELQLPNMKFDEFNAILKNVPFALKDKLRSNIQAIIGDQDDELKKRMFFIASQKLDTTDSVDALIKDMSDAAAKYTTTSGVLNVAATNAVSGTVNSARNAVFQTPEVFEEIESFVIVNSSPVAPICQNLVGRVFSKEEYKTADLPPYHHNCETTVRAQLVGQKNNKPTNPIGLTPTGSPDEVAKIIKSKTFNEG